MATPPSSSTPPLATAVRKPQNRLSTLKASDCCEGKSKFFLEHQALWEKQGNKGYDTTVHGWRYACQQLPLPEGKWPDASKFPRHEWDEHAKEEASRRAREEKRRAEEAEREEARRLRRIEGELQQRRRQFASGKAPSCRRLARAGEGHVNNVQMALDFINSSRCPGKKYELMEITVKNTMYDDIGSEHCHYNFIAYSPTYGFEFFFAEVDASHESKRPVLQCCTVWSGPHGYCFGCENNGVFLVHPCSDKFIVGNEEDVCWC